ncbi:L-glutamine:D-fructose-6-P amidotransferase [Synechocystis sp. PCC 6803]|uniref:Glutamine--fructose-6-phosphate aminotransferase [isomerizing] n=1 Tax=Synechocystis sp. (strain ATCC 27184 / PCC 6803 / Kazusa) TaxID=1111708 RepID=GLMS_SYNY3|nr:MULTISPECIES: glutamine--fructose-6-phosphate transaminase (isomerizing) [unclassified Synechocystis]P72720.3 RecName: Full=Glutamine--fructose-6-phosphate aminotransferase [isomerizing]; AltName: Full=D-fructose-6-phosphate amidotransferase; AltName: Full=GFAT; AltName: Full=Glucosamine-6-phosphate synthase; AltName: Full=Hexosephosphate aminotransferase; AltName: Full=L-glutamine--D-fructose-6-phosphate amidotransferase [Synechocystis sp. PCC 6803 substr. Kazusa]BAM50431.1 glucosamine--fruct
MCGIVGYIGTQTAVNILIEGLERLEYRGYDSAGIATVTEGKIESVRAKGKLFNLKEKLENHSNFSRLGIGHTRWATHGKPEEHNAHPHLDNQQRIAVVQNGIIENYQTLRDQLKEKGYQFYSETDTEVIPILIADILKDLPSDDPDEALLEAIGKAVHQLEGAFAIAVLDAHCPEQLIVARQQAPLILGFGQGEFFCASDVTALVHHTTTVLSLENGEIARLTPLGVEVYDFNLKRVRKLPRTLDWSATTVEKQGFRHFMLKEIYEQPAVVRTCLATYLNEQWRAADHPSHSPVFLGLDPQLTKNLQHIQVLACGTSWHAGLVGKYLLEQLAGIPTTVHYASEFRYAAPPLTPHTLTIGVTQSGETADTLAALEMEKQRRLTLEDDYKPLILGITNRPESTLATMVNEIINTHAGIEIGVAATKTFVAQVLAFYFLALDIAFQRHSLSLEAIEHIMVGLRQLPAQIETILEQQGSAIEALAHEFAETQDFIFLGRGINFPIALEGALKLKEISYIHAEGYPAGEMKHGPIALLDAKVPVVAIAMPGSVHDKVISNAQEAKARDARLIGVTPMDDSQARSVFDDLLLVPHVEEMLSPIVAVIPLQLLSYHIAARRGLDVDQPRNLAKSVTVE